ncbi:glutamate receptor 2-like isoform X2 [Mizuhopecten yessoensis]|uniref:glutamate receptor 2-like isoform X2 n=1 Tax=Mizuhopecten yessoensis TaxID=6573 RepID=UPI000B4588F7|nr:glutamate receptor 2-like isoform X2 [Mizuhopecten yessoensis]
MALVTLLYLQFTLLMLCLASDDNTVQIAVIQHTESEDFNELQTALEYTVRSINERNLNSNVSFDGTKIEVDLRDSYAVLQKLCQTIEKKPVHAIVILGPESSQDIVRSLVQNENVMLPLFLPTALGNTSSTEQRYQINMMPSYILAIMDIARFYGWDMLYYIFDSDEGLQRLQNLYGVAEGLSKTLRFTIRPRRITNVSDCYELLRSLDRADAELEVAMAKRIVLDLSSKQAYNKTLEQIINVGMNRDSYHYIIGGLGIDELDLAQFEYGGVNITGFTVINTAAASYTELRNRNKELYFNLYPNTPNLLYKQALVIDTLNLIHEGFDQVKREMNGNLALHKRGCTSNRYLHFSGSGRAGRRGGSGRAEREQVMRIFRETRLRADESLTGTLAFDEKGMRTDYTLDVHQLEYKKHLDKVGTWSPNGPPHLRFQTHLKSPVTVPRHETSKNRTWRIVTIQEVPFVQFASSTENGENSNAPMIGNRRLEGYCIDVAEKVKHRYKKEFDEDFEYTIHLNDKFGSVNETTHKWNGLIGELIDHTADLALASLTINKERERVVDFTKPFMKLGISIMIKKPDKQKPGVFSFMSPLSNLVWICVMIAFLAVSLVLFFVGRWSPYEWQEETSSKDHTTTNAFTFSNTLWFSLGALMQQGSDIFPRSFSGRIVGSAWWFFTLILISSYTANLAAFLTIERLVTSIKSADDLAKQTEIEYGTYQGGATERFFKESRVPVYQRMWMYMNANADRVMVDHNHLGIQKVRDSKGKYAFLLESPLNNYQGQKKPCNTMKVGENLDSKGYGIATPLYSPLRKKLNLVVLRLREEGELHKLEQKWWYDKGECGAINSKDGVKSALTLSNVSGIFHILIGGLVLSMLMALLEYLLHRHRKRKKQQKQYKPGSTVKIVKKDPLEVLKAAGYTEHENSGYTYNPPEQLTTFEGSPSTKPEQTVI